MASKWQLWEALALALALGQSIHLAPMPRMKRWRWTPCGSLE
jgi:hypothetical protein